MTNRKFLTRKKKQVADIKYNRKTTALAKLNNRETIKIIFNDSKFIYRSKYYFRSIICKVNEIYMQCMKKPSVMILNHSNYFSSGMSHIRSSIIKTNENQNNADI